MIGLVVAVMISPVSDLVLDGLQRSHEGSTVGSFTVRLLLDNIGETRNRHDVAFRWPNEFRIKTYHQDSNELLRDIAIEPSRIVHYDPELLQYTVKARGPDADILNDVMLSEQGLSEIVVTFIHKSAMGIWINDILRAKTPWKVTATTKRVRLNFEGDGQQIEIDIDKRSFLVSRVFRKTGLQRQEWKLVYDTKPKSTRFTPPTGSYQVPFFDRDIQEPTYEDSAAKAVTQKLFAAYSGLTSIGYTMQREDDTTTVHLHTKFVKQDDSIAEWTYDGRILVFHNKLTGKWYRGRASFIQVIDAVASLGTRVDPTVMLLMRGINPYRRILGDGAHMTVTGTSKSKEGDELTLLEADSDNANITLYVRDRDGLVHSTLTRVKGTTANEVTSELVFDYFEVLNNVQDALKLVAPPGTSFTPVEQVLTASD